MSIYFAHYKNNSYDKQTLNIKITIHGKTCVLFFVISFTCSVALADTVWMIQPSYFHMYGLIKPDISVRSSLLIKL